MYARHQDGGTEDMGTGLVGVDESPDRQAPQPPVLTFSPGDVCQASPLRVLHDDAGRESLDFPSLADCGKADAGPDEAITLVPAPIEIARAAPRGDFICEDDGRVLFRVGPIVGDGDGATVHGQPISELVQRCLAAGHKRVAYEEPHR